MSTLAIIGVSVGCFVLGFVAGVGLCVAAVRDMKNGQ